MRTLEPGQNRLFQLKIKQALELDPADFSPHYCSGRYLQSQKKDHAEAAKHYRLVLEWNLDHYEALYYLGLASEAVGDSAEAKTLYQRAIIAAGRADLCAIARPHLADPAWTLHEAARIGVTTAPWPKQYHSGKAQYETNLARAGGGNGRG